MFNSIKDSVASVFNFIGNTAKMADDAVSVGSNRIHVIRTIDAVSYKKKKIVEAMKEDKKNDSYINKNQASYDAYNKLFDK